MSTWTVRLGQLGLTLPEVAPATAGSAPAVLSGGHVHTAGQLPLVRGVLPVTGSVGAEVGIEQAADLARTAALNALAAIDAVAGIDTVTRIVRLVGYVASAAGFTGQSAVLDGASELLHQVFGERGAPARTVVGVIALPLGSPVEVELLAAVAADEPPDGAWIRTGPRARRIAPLGDGRGRPDSTVTVRLRRSSPPATARIAAFTGALDGRHRELSAFPDRARPGRGARLLLGQADLGRTALLDAAAVLAGARTSLGAGGPRDRRRDVARTIRDSLQQGLDHILTGRWVEADRLLDEGLELCDAHGCQLLAVRGRYGQALLAALRGDAGTGTGELTGRAGSPVALAYAAHVRAVAALGRGDYEQAYQHAATLIRPGRPPAYGFSASMDLVEAAVHTRRTAEAAAYVAGLRQAGIAARSPRLALLVAGSAALADAAPESFEEALAVPGADRWPFDLARIRLAYGERLRRTGASTGARVQLAAAVETFDRLGAAPWSARAGAELRATGRTRSRPGRLGPAGLTPQESEIAQLAAAGLSNKEIGARLYLSHRTVGSHLHHVFPKLGVTSRAALRDALSRTAPAEYDGWGSPDLADFLRWRAPSGPPDRTVI